MRIRRKHTNLTVGGSYEYWKNNILSKHVEENYEILTHPEIVDVFETNISNGIKKYVETTDKNIAIEIYINKSDIYSIRPTTAIFDEFYRMTSKPTEAIVAELVNIVIPSQTPIRPKRKSLKIKTISHMNLPSKIFISHSSEDRKFVQEIINIIEAIGVRSDKIFCSSFEGYGIGLGEDFLEILKKELNENVFVIFVLSDNFYRSPICLCEMGATWIKTNIHVPVLIPPFDFDKMKGVIQTTQGLKINEPLKMNLLKEKIETSFKLEEIRPTIWEQKRNQIIERVNNYIQADNKVSIETALEKLRYYFNAYGFSSVSFESIKININSEFDEAFLMDLIGKKPNQFKRVKLKNGKFGLNLIR